MLEFVVKELVAVVYGSYFPTQTLHKFYKHVNKWNMTTTNIKKQFNNHNKHDKNN